MTYNDGMGKKKEFGVVLGKKWREIKRLLYKIWYLVVKKHWEYWLVLVFGVILTVGVWGMLRGVLYGDDATFHATRLRATIEGWKDGQVVPQVYPGALNGLGYAYNIFYGPLPTYVAALLRIVAGSWPVAINLLLIIAFIASGLTMCYFIRKMSGKATLAALAGIIYMAEPYHLLNLYTRFALGELVSMIFVPILFLGLWQLVKRQPGAVRNIIIAGAGMLLTHNLSTLLFAMVAVVYLIVNWRQLRDLEIWKKLIIAGVTIVGLTAFFTLPLFEVKTQGDYGVFNAEYSAKIFGANVKSLNDWGFSVRKFFENDFRIERSTVANLSFGVVAWIGVVGFWLVQKKSWGKEERRMLYYLYIVALVAAFLVTKYLDWKYMPKVLYSIQFPWRFLEIFSIAMAIVSAYVIHALIANLALERQKLSVVVIGFMVLLPVQGLYLFQEGAHMERGAMPVLIARNASAGGQIEYAPMALLCDDVKSENRDCGMGIAYDKIDARGNEVEVLEGKVKLGKVEREGTHFEITLKNGEAGVIELPMIYYPGYVATLDGKKIVTQASERLGFVAVEIPAGHEGATIEVRYGMSKMTKLGIAVTVVTVAAWAGFGGWQWYKKRQTQVASKDEKK